MYTSMLLGVLLLLLATALGLHSSGSRRVPPARHSAASYQQQQQQQQQQTYATAVSSADATDRQQHFTTFPPSSSPSLSTAAALKNCMPPWDSSIAKALASSSSSSLSSAGASAKGATSPSLLFMDFYQWQLRLLKEQLGAKPIPVPDRLRLAVNEQKGARIASECFETKDFRRIRMTYFDAGDKVQVFNSLWYPRLERGEKGRGSVEGAPLLGIDLLCFGSHKMLAVVDCQPLKGRRSLKSSGGGVDEEGGSSGALPSPHGNAFAGIRRRYPSLCGKMSSRYYDENQFFSDAMLFGRFEDRELVATDLFPAYQEYLTAYLDHIGDMKNLDVLGGSNNEEEEEEEGLVASLVRGQQMDYDQYSADRDPAHALFKSYFGDEWADDYMHDFLFTMADRTKTVYQPPQFGNQKQNAK